MGALRRVLIALFGLIFLGLSVLTAAALIDHSFAIQLARGLESFSLSAESCLVQGKYIWCLLLIAGVALVLGVLLLIVACRRRRPIKQVTVEALDGGSVHVSLSAIDTVIRRAAANVFGVSEVTTRLRVNNAGALHMRLNFSLPGDGNVAELGASLRREVCSQLESMMGVKPASIDIAVTNVSDKTSGRTPQGAASEHNAADALPPEEGANGLE